MIINYDKARLTSALSDFYLATGITLHILNEDFSTLGINFEKNKYCLAVQGTEQGKICCKNSDIKLLEKCRESRNPEIHICHAGLADIAVPIIYNDNIVGYIIMGQMKTEKSFSEISDSIKHLPLDMQEMQMIYSKIPEFDSRKIEGASRLALMLARYILLDDMLKPNFNRYTDAIDTYILNNLDQSLSTDKISKGTNLSKSTLYKCLHATFGCTVSQYVTIKRVEKAKELLLNTDLSIEEIARETGFSSSAYFTKNFKKIKGATPLKFRKAKLS